ncbi:GNAT family N-acetyltransferase [Actinacidiphila glaucinigra]|uniref:GNAT family N-acetyltransferase n=1 Tax=Actinacidiphila glaucinigra TaxID=235986 RepID=UPI002E311DDA|nr:GNAT family N-acetyltransferase [Actinacidiphila glaucinigra]
MAEPAAILRSDQAVLRRWRTGDLDALDRAITESLEHLMPWMPWAADHGRHRTAGFLAGSHEEWATGEAFAYAITTDGTVIGGCGLHRRIGAGGLEIGYWLHPRWTGRGLATGAVAALVDEGFTLPGIERLEIHHDAANAASAAVARRLGFAEVARVPEPEGPSTPGEVGIEVVRRLTADQWRPRDRSGMEKPPPAARG